MGPPLPRVRHACRPAKPGTGPPFAPRLPAADPSSGAGETGRRSRPRRTAAILPASGPTLTFSAYGSGMSRLPPAIPLRRPQVGRSFPHGGRKNKLTASCRSLRQQRADMRGRAASPPAVPVSPPCGWRPSSPVPHGVGGNMASEQALRPVRRVSAARFPPLRTARPARGQSAPADDPTLSHSLRHPPEAHGQTFSMSLPSSF